ncbi:MAG: hypothetical protein ACXWPM_10610 [Bdellovibrionota bacterium]
MSKSSKFLVSAFLFIIATGTLGASAAHADEHWGRRRPGPRIEPRMEWGHGRWIHDRHNGRLGWWWIVGNSWFFYDRPHSFVQVVPPPVVVEQAPPVVIQQQPLPPAVAPPIAPPASPVLYYCKATGTHYPETMSCPGGWTIHTAETPPQS